MANQFRMHGWMCIFCGKRGMHSDRCSEHHAHAGVYFEQVLCASVYTCAYTLGTGCACALMYVQLVHLALGNENGLRLDPHVMAHILTIQYSPHVDA